MSHVSTPLITPRKQEGLRAVFKLASFKSKYVSKQILLQLKHLKDGEGNLLFIRFLFCVFSGIFSVKYLQSQTETLHSELGGKLFLQMQAGSNEWWEGSDRKIAFVQPWIITNNPLKGSLHYNYLLCVALLRGTLLPSISLPCLVWQM